MTYMKHRKIISILILIIILIVFSVSAYYYRASFEFLSIFVRDALWASVLVTTVLVVINAYYAWQTRQTIREMEKARKAEFIPHVRVELSWLGPVFLVLKATNFGKGPATNVKAEITFLPSNEKRIWEEAVLSPNESIRISLPEGIIEKVCEKSANITVKGECKDIFGQTFKIDETIDTKDFIEQAKQLRQLLERDIAREVEGIKKELQEIVTEVCNIRRELERQHEHGETA
jgi:prepilin signal peptidase PulO-like enzyme (type II secretory pathway)